MSRFSIFLICVLSEVSMTICDATSEYILARPYTETSSSAASMYFAAGPLTAEPPIRGLTTTTFFLDLDNSFRIPLIERIGPMLVNGLPVANLKPSLFTHHLHLAQKAIGILLYSPAFLCIKYVSQSVKDGINIRTYVKTVKPVIVANICDNRNVTGL